MRQGLAVGLGKITLSDDADLEFELTSSTRPKRGSGH